MIFIIINLVFFTFKFINFSFKKITETEFVSTKKNYLKELNIDKVNSSEENKDIFLIVLDGMIDFDLAEKYGVINKKQSMLQLLNKKNFKINEKFHSNYNSTYLSLISLLESVYPVVPGDNAYKNRKSFFPYKLMNSTENNLFKILQKTNRDFFWLGNEWAACTENIYINCINSNLLIPIIFNLKKFYNQSAYSYFFNYLLEKLDNENLSYVSSLDFFSNQNLYENTKFLSKKGIYLIHVMSPHTPHKFNKDCSNIWKKINFNDELNFLHYSYAYNCILKKVLEWSDKINDDHLIFIFGDHGWYFDINRNNELQKNYNISVDETRFKSFFSYRSPDNCSKLNDPSSIVNILRFALNCADNSKLKYLENKKFLSFYEKDSKYGYVNELKK